MNTFSQQFKKIIFILMILLSANGLYAQLGCTNPVACNYDAAAIEDDGSCHYQSAIANAGPDQYIAQTGVYSVPLAANTPVSPAIGTWSTSSTFVSVSDIHNPTANVNFASAAYPIADLLWTVYDSICGTVTTDNVQIKLTGCNFSESASAGSNLNNVCQGDTVAVVGSIANFPVIHTWSLVSGSGTVINPYDQVAYITNLGLGQNIFQYTTNYSACGGSTSSDTNSITTIECIEGCTDNNACNFNADAVVDDGSCDYSCIVPVYCVSTATQVFDEDITLVSIGSLSNSSTCFTTGGEGSALNLYSNYTALAAPDLVSGSSYPLAVGIASCNNNFTVMVAAFIDFNFDGDLTDEGEMVFESEPILASNETQIVTGNVVLPANCSNTGNTRMRIICLETQMPNSIEPCGTYLWGETEDYTVNLIPAPACDNSIPSLQVFADNNAVCFGHDFTLNLEAYNFCGLTLQWMSADDAAFTINVDSLGNAPTQIVTMTDDKYYRCLITCNDGPTTVASQSIFITAIALCGCTDPEACNYDNTATTDDSSCDFTCIGCIDVEASNYNPQATINQGCLYYSGIIVFHDINADGVRQQGEPGLQNWPIYISALSALTFSNNNGTIDLTLPPSPYIFQLNNNSANWQNTTPLIQSATIPSNIPIEFGLTPINSTEVFVAAPYDGFWNIFHCTNGYESGININNIGTSYLNGTITLTCDNTLTPEADAYATIGPDITGPGFAQWDITNFAPGSLDMFSFHVDGPGVEMLGNMYNFTIHLELVDANNVVVYDNTWINTTTVACAYDPNDLTAQPVGYTDQHFILAGDRIQFKIRFQNEGNLAAEDILVMDDLTMLNQDVFDISTFEPLYGSANYTACLHDDGMVDFIFTDINLPPAMDNEEASHGFVVYTVQARNDLVAGNVLYNKAYIIFDANPPIVTNEVFHTIFNCNSITGIVGENDLCLGEPAEFSAEQMYVESYNWFVDANAVSNDANTALNNLAAGAYNVSVELINPLCEVQYETTVMVNPLPTINSGSDIEICAGESITLNANSNGPITWSNGAANGTSYSPAQSETLTATSINTFNCTATDELNIAVNDLPGITILENGAELTAPDGSSWQWYYNGELIVGATEQVYVPATEGEFYVVTINSSNCSAQSTSVFMSSVGEGNAFNVIVYPNPVHYSAMVMLPAGIFQIALYDQAGKLVENFGPQQSQFILERKSLAAGSYQLTISNNKKSSTVKIVLN